MTNPLTLYLNSEVIYHHLTNSTSRPRPQHADRDMLVLVHDFMPGLHVENMAHSSFQESEYSHNIVVEPWKNS